MKLYVEMGRGTSSASKATKAIPLKNLKPKARSNFSPIFR
jgi:hypothetical protein